jgi:putative hydrolase of the HAD superfamily
VTLKAVLFDAGNTLLFLDFPRLAQEVGAAVGLPLTPEGLVRHAKAAALALERRGTTDRERATVYLETLFVLAGVPPERLEVVRQRLWELHHERHLWSAMDPATPEALQRLRAGGLRLGVVSNSDGRVEEALRAARLEQYFEVVIDSHLVGFEKPDPRIFHAALGRLGVLAAEAVYVGDIYEVDVVGARRAGLDVILLDPLDNHAERDARTARNLSEVARELLARVAQRTES